MIVICIENGVGNMVWISFHRFYSIKIKGLCIKNIPHLSLLKHLNHLFCAPAEAEFRFPAFLFKDLVDKNCNSKGCSAGSRLHCNAIFKNPGFFHEGSSQFSDKKPVRTFCYLCCA